MSTNIQNNNATSNTHSTKIVIKSIDDLDPYVQIQNNQFKLELPTNIIVPVAILKNAQIYINEQNNIIDHNHLSINPDTKTATLMLDGNIKDSDNMLKSKYHKGVNKIILHWNYARIYVNKSTGNLLKAGSIGAITQFLGKLPNAYTKAAAGALAGVLSIINIKGGFWFDYNYFEPYHYQNFHWQ
ncbi:hypothetical protein [Lentilactobacillus senioris]|uniref:hypothetical protein n=1 Tax=Lentilactobacillus senioris TaxID=931534 RepID=UPI003D2ACA4B